jgi:serine protease Do
MKSRAQGFSALIREKLLSGLTATAIAFLVLVYVVPFARAQSTGIQRARTLQGTFVRIAESVTPSVAYIRTEGTMQHPLVSRRPDSPAPPLEDIPRRGFGSGIIFDPRGYILTNYHVIEGSTRILVTLPDQREFVGELVGSDQRTDIAVVRIRAGARLKSVPFGDSDRLRVGQWVMAIGHPYGLERSVTVGVVSGTGRTGIGVAHYENFIQTDTAIHPGNSGGPLINLDGEVIGINTAIVSRANGGIGFAIPTNMARRIAEKLMKEGRVVRGFLGVVIQEVTREMAPKFGLVKPRGVLVADLFEGGASEKAGLRRGDVVLEFGGKRIRDVPELQRLAAATLPGSRVNLKVRRGGKNFSASLIMEALPSQAKVAPPNPSKETSPYGLELGDLTANMKKLLANRGVRGGVQVTGVLANSRAVVDGIQVGDVIAEIEHRPITDKASFHKVLKRAPKDVLALIYRTGQSLYRILHNPR